MTAPHLSTKLHIPPVRPELVSRLRLIEPLNVGLPGQSGFQVSPGFSRKLTLVSAPAGLGKMTLVTEWLNSAELPITCVLAALKRDAPNVCHAFQAMLQAPCRPREKGCSLT